MFLAFLIIELGWTKAVFTWFLVAIFLHYLLVYSVRACFSRDFNVRMLHLLITDPLLSDKNKTEQSTSTKEKFLLVISWLSLPLLSWQVNESRWEDEKKRRKALTNMCLAVWKDHGEATVIAFVSNTTEYPRGQRIPHPSFQMPSSLHFLPWRLASPLEAGFRKLTFWWWNDREPASCVIGSLWFWDACRSDVGGSSGCCITGGMCHKQAFQTSHCSC